MSIVFHVGLHKTGTTFLQKEVFPVIDECYLIRTDIYDLITRPEEKISLVSYELLSGHPWRGKWFSQFKNNVETIGCNWPQSSCIIGFRRHDRLVESLYKQYLQQGGVENVRFLFSPDGSGKIRPSELSFQRRIEVAEEHFSEVFVYTQEEMKSNFESFITRLQEFLGVGKIRRERINRSQRNVGVKTNLQVNLLRRLNQIDASLKNSPMPTLHNRMFRILCLTPRSLCQHRLRGVGREPWALPKEIKKYLRNQFADDWKYVRDFSS